MRRDGAELKPLLFTDPMIRAIQQDRKTETRRLDTTLEAGDIAYCRERWFPVGLYDAENGEKNAYVQVRYRSGNERLVYIPHEQRSLPVLRTVNVWKPGIHMPKFMAREFLEVELVRREPLWRIRDDDVEREGTCIRHGFTDDHIEFPTWLVDAPEGARGCFASAWDGINGERPGGAWNLNPTVSVVRFKRVSKPLTPSVPMEANHVV